MRGCLHQIFPPRERDHPPGWGDCRTCQTDPGENSRCAGYQPIEVLIRRVGWPAVTIHDMQLLIPASDKKIF